jgi:hypothetical protein
MKKKRHVFQIRTDAFFLKALEETAKATGTNSSAYVKRAVKMQILRDKAEIRRLAS